MRCVADSFRNALDTSKYKYFIKLSQIVSLYTFTKSNSVDSE